jgi:hypothetical protein
LKQHGYDAPGIAGTLPSRVGLDANRFGLQKRRLQELGRKFFPERYPIVNLSPSPCPIDAWLKPWRPGSLIFYGAPILFSAPHGSP